MNSIKKLGLLPVLTLSILTVGFFIPANSMDNAAKNPVNMVEKKVELNRYKIELREINNYLETCPGVTTPYIKGKKDAAKKLEEKIKQLESEIK